MEDEDQLDLELEDQTVGDPETPEELPDELPEELSDEEPVEQPKRSRAQLRIEALREQTREAQLRADDFERRLRQYEQEHRSRETYLDQQAEEQRLMSMSYEERLDYKLNKAMHQQRQFEETQRFVSAEQQDRLAFQTYVQSVPEFQQLAPQVETELVTIRNQYKMNVPRQVLLATLLGLRVMQNASQVGQQRQQGQQNIRRQRTAPSSGGSDVQRRERREKTARERLEGVVF